VPAKVDPMHVGAFHPKDKSRAGIDAKLSACGWIVQNKQEMDLSAGPGVVVREFATTAGPVDYALFVDRIFCGVVEAKAAGTTLSGFSEQASGYLSGAPDHLPGSPEQRRFEYARPTPRQSSATLLILSRARVMSLHFTGRKHCGCG
jgi:type I restriction enzyme, R subunit